MKRIGSILMAGVLAMTAAACGAGGGKENAEGKVTLTVGDWPNQDTKPEDYERAMKRKAEFEQKNPGIKIEPDVWGFSVDTFLPKAAANQLPDLFYVPYTEVDKIVDSGYGADLTEKMEEYGYIENMSETVLEQITRKGKTYFMPLGVYALGVLGNKKLFEEAGELNADGTISYPQTFEELGELAGRIREKTGKAGFIMPTMKNSGGWHFMNIAWAYGTEFMAKEGDKWVAKFSSPECEEALQFVKDLKWKYNALSDNMFIDNAEGYKMFATDQGAMYFSNPDAQNFTKCVVANGMDGQYISAGKIPAGPAGRYALMGGGLRMMPTGVSEEEIDAGFKWHEYEGYAPIMTEDGKNSYEDTLKSQAESKVPILPKLPFNVWKSGDVIEVKNQLHAQYATADMKDFSDYFDFEGVKVKAEEPVSCQELYAILDNCIQAVIGDENADVHQLLKDAANNFQVNYLDNAK